MDEQFNSSHLFQQEESKSNSLLKLKIVLFFLFTAIMSTLLLLKIELVKEYLGGFLTWTKEAGAEGMCAFILLYALCGMIFFPIVIFTLGAGYVYSNIYGTWLGLLIACGVVYIGSFLAACISMPISRYLFRSYLQEQLQNKPYYLALEDAINEYGFTLVALWRLPPILPFTLFNYIVGVSSISYKDYLLASVAMVPGTFVEVYIGTSINSVQEAAEGNLQGGTFTLGLVIGGLVVGLLGLTYVSVLAKRRIDQILGGRMLLNTSNKSVGGVSS